MVRSSRPQRIRIRQDTKAHPTGDFGASSQGNDQAGFGGRVGVKMRLL